MPWEPIWNWKPYWATPFGWGIPGNTTRKSLYVLSRTFRINPSICPWTCQADTLQRFGLCTGTLPGDHRRSKNTKNNPGEPFPKCGRDRSSGNPGEYQDFAYRGGIQDTCPAVRGNVFWGSGYNQERSLPPGTLYFARCGDHPVSLSVWTVTDISPDDFRLVVDYPDFVQKESGRIIPLLEASPNLISHVILAPQFVDGIIQNRY